MQSKYTDIVDHFSLISSHTIKSLKNNGNIKKIKKYKLQKKTRNQKQ